MPHQVHIAMVGGEYDPVTGLPFFEQIVAIEPRQSGKTSLNQGFAFERSMRSGFRRSDPGGSGELLWVPGPQRIAYTAQTGVKARVQLLDPPDGWLPRFRDRVPFLLAREVLSAGRESIRFVNGSMIAIEYGGEGVAHGTTNHLTFRDELWADHDDLRDQGLAPTTSTVEDSQDIVTSSAGTMASTPLLRIRDEGRARFDDPSSTVAYFEYSAPDDADPDDPATWRACMPALGFTQTVRKIRGYRERLTDGEFRRAYLAQWVDGDDDEIPASLWRAAVSPGVVAVPPLVYAVDASRDLSAAAVAVADIGGRVELGEHRSGVAWLDDYLIELWGRHGSPIALDARGPVGGLGDRLEAAGVKVIRLDTRGVQFACQWFRTAVYDGKVRAAPSPDLDDAVKDAARRPMGDAWMWVRSGGSAPLLAATFALHAARGDGDSRTMDQRVW